MAQKIWWETAQTELQEARTSFVGIIARRKINIRQNIERKILGRIHEKKKAKYSALNFQINLV